MLNLKKFFYTVRAFAGSLDQGQIDGFQHILKKVQEADISDHRWTAYMLGTAWHETAKTMEPVTEYGSQAYLKSKKYYPFVGRGYVQLTWDYNYKRYGILDEPERALDPDFAAYIMIDGMTKGIFTGKKLSDYFNASTEDWVNARRIINGLDRAQEVGKYGKTFYEAIKAGME